MQHKVAVIGHGHWAKTRPKFFELAVLGAVCDPDPDIATRMAEQYKVAKLAGFETICEDDEISGLVIAAPAPSKDAPLSLQASRHA